MMLTMRSESKICLACAILGLVLLSLTRCQAQASHPRLPALSSFDKKTVQMLVDAIGIDHNASALKYGYFMRRGAPPLPQSAGYAIVAAALNKETVGTQRWFLLDSVRAFAAFRVSGVSPDDGFAAYGEIFSHAADAHKVKATNLLHQAIISYVFTVPGRFAEMGLLSDSRTGSLLLKAWTVYTTSVVYDSPGLPDPPWTAAIQRTKSAKNFLPVMEKTLHDPAIPKTYVLLKTAAGVYHSSDPVHAIALLQQAEPRLPQDAGERHWYYSTLVGWLTDTGKFTQAIKVTRAGIKVTGQGLGTLAVLQLKNGNHTGLKATLESLSSPNTSGREINIAADGLNDPHTAEPGEG